MSKLLISRRIIDLVVAFQSEPAIEPRRKLRYGLYVGAAIWNARKMIGLDEPTPDLVRRESRSSKQRLEIRLPFLENRYQLRLRFPERSDATNADRHLLRIISDIFSGSYEDVMRLELDDMAECLLLAMDRIIIAEFLRLAFEAEHKVCLADDLVDSTLVLLERVSSHTYEGSASELNIAILPKRARNNHGTLLDRQLFDSKRSRALMLGHRHLLVCDREGMIVDVNVAPYWQFGRKDSLMFLAPYEYQPLLNHGHRNKAMTFMLTRHGEVFAALGPDILCFRRDGFWGLFGIQRAALRIEDELRKMSVPRSKRRPLSVYSLMIALSVRNRRKGGMIVILADAKRVKKLQSRGSGLLESAWSADSIIKGNVFVDIPFTLMLNAVCIDGATVLTADGIVRDFGLVINTERHKSNSEGARTRAAEFVSKHGIVIKISEDGPIAVYSNGEALCVVGSDFQ